MCPLFGADIQSTAPVDPAWQSLWLKYDLTPGKEKRYGTNSRNDCACAGKV